MGDLKTRIRALSAKAELIVVMVTAFGWFIFGSLQHVVVLVGSGGALQWPPATETELIELLVFEAIVLLVLGWFLRVRGWTLDRFGLDPSWGHDARAFALGVALRAAQGVMLAMAVSYACQIASAGVSAILRQSVALSDAALIASNVGWATILGVCVLNSIFEELFLCGYLVTKLGQTRGIWFAIHASTAIRLTYHLYQGSAGVASIIVTGLIFGYWFARTQQLWPPIVAHGCLNLVALNSPQ